MKKMMIVLTVCGLAFACLSNRTEKISTRQRVAVSKNKVFVESVAIDVDGNDTECVVSRKSVSIDELKIEIQELTKKIKEMQKRKSELMEIGSQLTKEGNKLRIYTNVTFVVDDDIE